MALWSETEKTVVVNFALGAVLLTTMLSSGSTALFATGDVLDVELHGPVKELLADKANRQRSFQIIANGIQQPVSVKTGGRSRRKVCDFLPLRLYFDPDSGAGPAAQSSIFSGQQLLRVVTHCNFSARSEVDLIEEYLAYRILNLITESSYRVRLLRIKYVDTGQVGESMTHYAFATESEFELARRMGGRVLRISALPKKRLNEEHAAVIYIFQYLIGNTDWSLVTGTGDDKCCHNGQLIDVGSEIFYIPYDFDLAGLVNPSYARPDPSLRIDRVTRRLYRGYCGPPDVLRTALGRIAAHRESILNLYRQVPVLSSAERDKSIKFIEGFFRKAEDQEKLLELFQRRCLK
jgi:hypothetical protein